MAYKKCEICGLRSERKDGVKRYFMARFPLDDLRCKQWVKVTGKQDLAYLPIEKLHQLKSVCGKHFKDRDFKKKRTQLKRTATPSLWLTSEPLSDTILSEFPCRLFKEQQPLQEGVEPTLDLKVDEAWEDKPNDKTSEDHAEYFCNNCSKSIVGYRCVQCENFDLCRDCEAAMTHPQHYVLRIPRPRPFSEIKSILDAIREKINILSGELQETSLELDEIKLEPDFVDPAALDPLHDCVATSHVAPHIATSHVPTSHVALHSASSHVALNRATFVTSHVAKSHVASLRATSHDAGTSNSSLKSHNEATNNLPWQIATLQFNTLNKRPVLIRGYNNQKQLETSQQMDNKKPQAGPAMDPVVLLNKLQDKEVITLTDANRRPQLAAFAERDFNTDKRNTEKPLLKPVITKYFNAHKRCRDRDKPIEDVGNRHEDDKQNAGKPQLTGLLKTYFNTKRFRDLEKPIGSGHEEKDEKGFKRKKIDDIEETWLDEDILDEDIDCTTEELVEDSEQCPSDNEQCPSDSDQCPSDSEQCTSDSEQCPSDSKQ